MAKFNVVQRKRRALIADRKRVQKGDPATGKLKNKPQPLSISGKRKQKLLKKWRREQQEAVQKGLITMQDVEMSSADAAQGTSQEGSGSTAAASAAGFHMKKRKKGLKLKQITRKGGKGKKVKNDFLNPRPSSAVEAPLDSMVE